MAQQRHFVSQDHFRDSDNRSLAIKSDFRSCGTWQNTAQGAACPQLAEADVRILLVNRPKPACWVAIPTLSTSVNAAPVSPSSSEFGSNGY